MQIPSGLKCFCWEISQQSYGSSIVCNFIHIPACGIHMLWLQWTNSHGLQKSCWEKGTAWPPSKWERRQQGQRELTPAWTGFYCFSGHITSSMVLIYYAQVRCRWLPFTDDKGKNVAITSKRRMLQIKGKSGWTGYTPYLGGLAQTSEVTLKICSKHLLPQSRVRDF